MGGILLRLAVIFTLRTISNTVTIDLVVICLNIKKSFLFEHRLFDLYFLGHRQNVMYLKMWFVRKLHAMQRTFYI